MRRARVALVVVLAWVLSPVSGARADHNCNGVVTALDTPGGTFYFEDRGMADADLWLYMESNGTPWLQSGGIHLSGQYVDRCSHVPPADTLLF